MSVRALALYQAELLSLRGPHCCPTTCSTPQQARSWQLASQLADLDTCLTPVSQNGS